MNIKVLFILTIINIILIKVIKNEEILEPIQLIYPDSKHQNLMINQTTLALLNRLSEDQSILGVVGNFHSGKSFLLNQLLNTTDRFSVGPTVHPETMGIWLWASRITYNNQIHNIVLLDTEGFYSSNVSETYDAKIFAITTLLSSHLIYNSVKIIDQSSLEYLELLSRRTQLFALKSQIKNDSPLTKILGFPPLTWVVQDFFQDIGEQSATEWLHQLLRAHSRDQPDSSLSISKIFPSVDCHTLFIPSGDRTTLRHLDRAKSTDLSPVYRQEMDQLKASLFSSLRPRLKGPAIGSLIKLLVDVANSHSFPSVPSIWVGFIKQQQEQALQDSIATYKEKMSIIKSNDPPLTDQQYIQLEQSTNQYIQNLYKQLLFGLPEAYSPGLIKLFNIIKDIEESNHKINNERIYNYFQGITNNLYETFKFNLDSIKIPIGHLNLLQSIDQFQSKSLNDYVSKTINYAQSKSQSTFLTNLKNDLERSSTIKQLENKNEIESLLNNNVINFSEKYKLIMKSYNNYPSPLIDLDNFHINAKQAAIEDYKSTTLLAKDENYYDAYIAKLEKSIAQHYDSFKQYNEEKIMEKVKIVSSSKLLEFKRSSSQIILPVEDEYLESKLEQLKIKSIDSFKSDLIQFSSSLSFKDEFDFFNAMIDKQIELKFNENVQQMKLIVMDTLNNIKMVMKSRLSSFWFQYSFINEAKEQVDLKIRSKIESKRLRQRIIDNFIQSDLKPEIDSLFHFSSLIVTLVIILLLSLIFIQSR